MLAAYVRFPPKADISWRESWLPVPSGPAFQRRLNVHDPKADEALSESLFLYRRIKNEAFCRHHPGHRTAQEHRPTLAVTNLPCLLWRAPLKRPGLRASGPFLFDDCIDCKHGIGTRQPEGGFTSP